VELRKLTERAVDIRRSFRALEEKKFGRAWSIQEVAMGLASDVGDVLRLIMAREGRRDIPEAETKLASELVDCLWSLLVISDELKIDLEGSFLTTMADISDQISIELGVGDKMEQG
jgi:NTP pyrophosphatase (non-canonical NTP hydrolase)